MQSPGLCLLLRSLSGRFRCRGCDFPRCTARRPGRIPHPLPSAGEQHGGGGKEKLRAQFSAERTLRYYTNYHRAVPVPRGLCSSPPQAAVPKAALPLPAPSLLCWLSAENCFHSSKRSRLVYLSDGSGKEKRKRNGNAFVLGCQVNEVQLWKMYRTSSANCGAGVSKE